MTLGKQMFVLEEGLAAEEEAGDGHNPVHVLFLNLCIVGGKIHRSK